MSKQGQIVTLTTDWSNNGSFAADADSPYITPLGDHYIAQLKGILIKISPDIKIIDISHKVEAHNSGQAAYLLKSVYPLLPAGTIHLMGINSEPSPRNSIIFAAKNGHYFIGPNDGIFSMVFDGEPDYTTEIEPDNELAGFAALKLFAVAVKHITDGKDPETIGKKCEMQRDIISGAAYDENTITGTIVLIDVYGNIITNISRSLFDMVGRGRAFRIYANNSRGFIDRISRYYDDVFEQHPLALFNSSQMLEIAIRNGNMARFENLDSRSVVRINFDGTRLF